MKERDTHKVYSALQYKDQAEKTTEWEPQKENPCEALESTGPHTRRCKQSIDAVHQNPLPGEHIDFV